MRSSVASLVGLSRFQLAGVVRELLGVLEGLNRVSAAIHRTALTCARLLRNARGRSLWPSSGPLTLTTLV